jgi:quercetin dioxygenase-like cupin family protein
MAQKNKVIINPKTAQEIKFITTAKESNGRLLEMISTYNSFSKQPPSHYHPYQAEDFTVISGELTVLINGKLSVLKKGEELHIPENTPHAMWNGSNTKTMVRWKVQPAMNTEHLLETLTGLAVEGKTNEEGRPGLLQTALLLNKYAKVFRMEKPPYFIQRILFTILSPLAYLSGYGAFIKRYVE